jgi:hypothetical protein
MKQFPSLSTPSGAFGASGRANRNNGGGIGPQPELKDSTSLKSAAFIADPAVNYSPVCSETVI